MQNVKPSQLTNRLPDGRYSTLVNVLDEREFLAAQTLPTFSREASMRAGVPLGNAMVKCLGAKGSVRS